MSSTVANAYEVMHAVVIALDLCSMATILRKTCYYRSGAGLSYHMLVCYVISAVLFPILNVNAMFNGAMKDLSVFIMWLNAVVAIVAFVAVVYKPKSSLHACTDAPHPLWCRWHVLVPVCTGVGLVLGNLSGRRGVALSGLLVPLYIDTAAKIPQLWMVARVGGSQDFLALMFMSFIILSRAVEVFSWVWTFSYNRLAVTLPTMFQVFFGFDFLYLWALCVRGERTENRSIIV